MRSKELASALRFREFAETALVLLLVTLLLLLQALVLLLLTFGIALPRVIIPKLAQRMSGGEHVSSQRCPDARLIRNVSHAHV